MNLADHIKAKAILGLVATSDLGDLGGGDVMKADLAFIDVTRSPYNAAGDGTTNDLTAIQSAIAAAASSKKAVYFPKGNYRVAGASTLLTFNGVKAFGDGMGQSSLLFEVTAAQAANCILISGNGSGLSDMTVSVDGDNDGIVGIRFNTSSGHRFERLEITGAPSFDGAFNNRVHGAIVSSTADVDDVVWLGCRIHDVSYGVFTSNDFTGTATNWKFLDCHFYANTADDLEFNSLDNDEATWDGWAVLGCHFYGWKGDPATTSAGFAVGTDSGRGGVISGCFFTGYIKAAIHLEDYVTDVVVSGNNFTGCHECVEVYPGNSGRITITGNVMKGRLVVALDAAASTLGEPNATVDNNDIAILCKNPGVESSPSGLRITENVISNYDIGIYLPVARGGVAESNTFLSCIVGAVTINSQASRFRNNTFFRCKYGVWAQMGGAIVGYQTFEDCANLTKVTAGKATFMEGFHLIKTGIAAIASDFNKPALFPTPFRIDGGFVGRVTSDIGQETLSRHATTYDGTTLTDAMSLTYGPSAFVPDEAELQAGSFCYVWYNGTSAATAALDLQAHGVWSFS